VPARPLAMSGTGLVRQALDPARSVVIEACAGSGKTWLLVSRIVRLLLEGAKPGEILAITFTRKAAQEMAARLRDWLELLAIAHDDTVRAFLRERAVPEARLDEMLARSRSLYEAFLTAQPSVTLATFHGWFMQLLRRAPLDAGAPGDVTLVEQTSTFVAEAWQLFARNVQRAPDSPAARGLDVLHARCGVESTRRLLQNFLHHRSDWWALTEGGRQGPGAVLASLRASLPVDPEADLLAQLAGSPDFRAGLEELVRGLERNTASDAQRAASFPAQAGPDEVLAWARDAVLTQKDEPRIRKPGAAQKKRLGGEAQESRFLELHREIAERVLDTLALVAEQESYRLNEAALHAGAVLLDAYQRAKALRQAIDHADVEWQACELVANGEHALHMQFKLDARYRHVLLDEFQDTNPLQWRMLEAWFAAAADAGLRPTVFLVGDPKQSIYRFRRAEPRLFDAAARWLRSRFDAERVSQDESRRCAPPIIALVNRLFGGVDGFAEHHAHHAALPGRIEVLPLVARATDEGNGGDGALLELRNPLAAPRREAEDSRREEEAALLAAGIADIVSSWHVIDDPHVARTRRARYADVMVLVRRRTHLVVYERALRHAGIPFVTSRQGGLLATLEAQDLLALLRFLVSPFDDLSLAHALRSPVFGCSDDDLLLLAAEREGTWWERLGRLAARAAGGGCPDIVFSGLPASAGTRSSPLPPGEGFGAREEVPRHGSGARTTTGASWRLARAHRLLAGLLARADALPVHDQLDRLFFEADVIARYEAAVPAAMRAGVTANLRAFMQHALDTDSGRYPSLPRFIDELGDLADVPDEEAPDEGIVGDFGDAVRIYTVHGAKGLEAPIVWLPDAATARRNDTGYDVLVDWPPEAAAPAHFSVWGRAADRSRVQRDVAEAERAHAAREDLNLLYVAVTRARQALIVSGVETKGADGSWYPRLRAAALDLTGTPADAPSGTVVVGADLTAASTAEAATPAPAGPSPLPDPRLRAPLPTGQRRERSTSPGQRYGTLFHAVMEQLTVAPGIDEGTLRELLGISAAELAPLAAQARRMLGSAELAPFFDPARYVRAENEVPYVDDQGALRRIDRLVEHADAVWVLDYKTGAAAGVAGTPLEAEYREQVRAYCAAVRQAIPGKPVAGVLLFTDGGRIDVAD